MNEENFATCKHTTSNFSLSASPIFVTIVLVIAKIIFVSTSTIPSVANIPQEPLLVAPIPAGTFGFCGPPTITMVCSCLSIVIL